MGEDKIHRGGLEGASEMAQRGGFPKVNGNLDQ